MIGQIVSAGLPIVGGMLQAGVQKKINEDNIEFAKQTVMQQRQWALDDWNMVNAYNHPAQQMNRYKEAGLNPQLIYGNAQNSPSALVRSVSNEVPKKEASGILSGIGMGAQATGQMLNTYFAQQKLENETALTQAQILNLKAQTDKTGLDNKLTRETWNDLLLGPLYKNLMAENQMYLNDTKRLAMPTREMAWDKYVTDTAKSDAQTKLLIELTKKAQLENVLRENDVQLLEKVATGPTGVKIAIDILKLIMGK